MKANRKTILKWILISVSCALLVFILYIAFAFLGNPITMLRVQSNAQDFLNECYSDTDYQVSKSGYNFKTGDYYAFIESPSSADSYFTVYFDGWGSYQNDTYESILDGSTTFRRLNEEYWNLVKEKLPFDKYDISIGFGELRPYQYYEVFTYTDASGEIQVYTLSENYGLDMSRLVLDGKYDILELGRNHGSICLYIHDPEVTTRRAAELLLEVTAYLDEMGVPFYAIDFHLCEPRNEEGQNVGNQISLLQFPYSEIQEKGLLQRVEDYWLIAQEHYAIQDGIKQESEIFYEEK